MSAGPSTAVRLYGTEEAVPPPRMLEAGPLSAELEAGNLRYIRYGGVELLRAVSFIVRDRNWGTYNRRSGTSRSRKAPAAFGCATGRPPRTPGRDSNTRPKSRALRTAA